MDNYFCGSKYSNILMYKPAEYSVAPTKGAMVVGAIMAAVMLIFGAFNVQIMMWLVFAGGIYFGMRTYRKVLGGVINYSNALNVGFQSAFFASLILAFFTFMNTSINPSLITEFIDAAEVQLKTSGLPSILVENTMQQWREILTPTIFGVIIIFSYSAAGGLISIVLALLVKNAKSSEFVEH